MGPLVAVPVALFPSVLWILVMRWWDRREPEPRGLIVRLFLAGVVGASVIFGLLLAGQLLFVSAGLLPPLDALRAEDPVPTLLFTAAFIAVTQELTKFVLTRWLVARSKAFTQIIDGVVYATTVAWGSRLWRISLSYPASSPRRRARRMRPPSPFR